MLCVAQLIESDGPGGAEQVVADLAMQLQVSGARSVVFVPAAGEGWLERQLAETGVAVEHFRLERPISPACARSLAAAFRRHAVDVAHSHEFSMAVYGAWSSWLAGVPHIITMHGSRYYARRLQRRIALRTAIARSDRLVAVSDNLADHMSRDLLVRRSRIEMVSNGVRCVRADGAAVRRELGLGPDRRLLVSIGNLYPVKGHRHLIDAMAMLRDRHQNLRLAIAGRGDLAEALTAQARDCGLIDRVHLLGLRSDVGALLAAADVFVLPSLSEGLPLALLEAMSGGRPIVASDVGQIGAALGGGEAGVLVPPGDPAALAAAIDGLLTQPARAYALAEGARARAAAGYDVSHMVQRYRSMYDQLLTRASLPAGAVPVGSIRPNL